MTQTIEVVSYPRRSWRDVELTYPGGGELDPGGREEDPGENSENSGAIQVEVGSE